MTQEEIDLCLQSQALVTVLESIDPILMARALDGLSSEELASPEGRRAKMLLFFVQSFQELSDQEVDSMAEKILKDWEGKDV